MEYPNLHRTSMLYATGVAELFRDPGNEVTLDILRTTRDVYSEQNKFAKELIPGMPIRLAIRIFGRSFVTHVLGREVVLNAKIPEDKLNDADVYYSWVAPYDLPVELTRDAGGKIVPAQQLDPVQCITESFKRWLIRS